MAVDYTPSFDPADVDSDYGSTGGDITVPTFTANMKPFRFWCQRALPLVYDDSLSYYEVLCKVVDQMNGFLTDLQTATGSMEEFGELFVTNQEFINNMAEQLGEDVDALETYINERMEDFTTAYEQLQSYVNNYFDNLDVQAEINSKLDEMAEDGTFNTLFDPVITAWMTAKTAQIDAAIANQDAIQAQQNGRISVLEGRMDGFASLPSGSTSGNAELVDIRTNFLGETYPSAGDAVRASDMIVSGFQSIGFTRLTQWDGNAESSVCDTVVFDVAAYKGGHVVVIANMENFVQNIEGGSGISLYGSNVAGKTVDSNAQAYPFPDGYSGLTSAVFKNYTILSTSIQGEERVVIQLSIPSDFTFQYLKLGDVEEIPQTTHTTPEAIVYANSWSKTPVDDTLTQAGEAADAKATGDAISSVSVTIPISTTKFSNNYKYNINTSGSIVSVADSNDYEVYYAEVKSGITYTVTTHDTSGDLICAFYSTVPTTSTSAYQSQRYIQSDMKITAPIDGYIAFRSTFTDTNEGISYDTANDRIARGSITTLQNEINAQSDNIENLEELLTFTPPISWEQGTLSDAAGAEGSSGIRIRTIGYIDLKKGETVKISSASEYVFQVYTWNDSYVYQGTTSDLTTYTNKYQNDAHLRIVLKKSANTSIVPSDGSNLTLTILGLRIEETAEKTIPTYWDSAIATAESSINSELASDEKAISFGFVTDTHIGNNAGYSGLLLAKVMKDCHIPVWFHGGDAVTGLAIITKDALIGQMNADFSQFAEIENIGLRAIGNHEPCFGTSDYNYNLNNGEINHYYHGIDREKYLQKYGEEKGYFYKDLTKDKLRCIVLDIVPYESQVNGDDLVTGSNKLNYHQFGSKQLNWFAQVLEDVPTGYSVVVCSHIAPVSLSELKTLDNSWAESVPIDYVQCRKIAEAYALKSSYSFSGTITGDTTGDSYSISVDFTNANGDFVCFFCGHTHKDFMLELDNVNIIGTANDSKAVSSNASSYAPSKTDGTSTEQIIDFFCIKPKTKAVSVVRLGAYLNANGLVRSFTY